MNCSPVDYYSRLLICILDDGSLEAVIIVIIYSANATFTYRDGTAPELIFVLT